MSALAPLVILLTLAVATAPPADVPSPEGEPALALAADAQDPPGEPPPTPPPPPPPGSVKGIVRHVGRTPLRVKVLTNTVDVAACGERVQSQALALGRGNTLGNVVIELQRPDGEPPEDPWLPAPETLVVSLGACTSEPHVAILPPGTVVEVVNPDHLHHELVTRAMRNVVWEQRLPRYARRLLVPARAVARPEAVRLGCERHPFMSAWWWITDNPRHVLTGTDGAFRLADVPPGSWVVHAWHEELGEVETTVEVAPGETATVALEYR